MLLENKVALITGGSRGIGAATAKLFGKEGAKVAVNFFQNPQSADEVVAEIIKNGGKAIAVSADIRIEEQINNMVSTVVKEFGDIDILVLNAGMTFRVAPFMEYNWDEFENKMLGEIKSAFYCCKAVLPSMVKRNMGSIIAVSSGLSKRSGYGFSSHSTTKSALNGFMRSLAVELGPMGIRVNTIAPGLTITDATKNMSDERKQMSANLSPLRRNAYPDDIAGAVLFYATDYAKFITGSYQPVDGGMTML